MLVVLHASIISADFSNRIILTINSSAIISHNHYRFFTTTHNLIILHVTYLPQVLNILGEWFKNVKFCQDDDILFQHYVYSSMQCTYLSPKFSSRLRKGLHVHMHGSGHGINGLDVYLAVGICHKQIKGLICSYKDMA